MSKTTGTLSKTAERAAERKPSAAGRKKMAQKLTSVVSDALKKTTSGVRKQEATLFKNINSPIEFKSISNAN